MKSFLPYSIKYLKLSDLDKFKLPVEQVFIIFFWNEIPLGHLWLKAGDSLTLPQFRNRIVTSISAAMNHYCKKAGVVDQTWKLYLQKGEIDELSAFLNSSANFSVTHTKNLPDNKVSVIICTRNRSELLKDCIKALLNSSDKNFELIIVDNAPDDNSTENLVACFPAVRYIRENRKGLDIARNTGAMNASNNIIAYTDDDVLVSKDWVRNLKYCFEDPDTFCVTGQVFPLHLATEAQFIFEKYWGFNKGYVPLVFDKKYFNLHVTRGVPVWEIGAGANMAFRKEIFTLAGFFDERLDVGAAGCNGDSELWYRIIAGGWICRYFPHLFVYHNHRQTMKELKKQLYNYMRGHIAALLIQYEKFHHRGNLVRMYMTMPKWYLNRFKNAILGKDKDGFLFTEIRGCISGWKFYNSNKKL